jgi:hypothetical protein
LSLPKENNAAGATSETEAATQGLVLANDSDTDRYGEFIYLCLRILMTLSFSISF